MPVEMIVNPAGMRAVWRTPKWPSPYCADNAADHRTNRPGDHQASAGPENRANSIRLRTRRSNGDRKNRCRSQQTLAHDRPPLSQPSSPAELAANWAMIWHSMWRTTAGSHLRDFFSPLLRKRHTCEPLHNASGHGKFSRNDSGRRIGANRSMTLQKINSSKIVCCLKAIACLFACFGVWTRPHSPLPTSNIGFQVDAQGAKRIAEERQNAGEGGRFPGGTKKRA